VYRAAGTYTVTYRLSGPAVAARVNTIQFDLLAGLVAREDAVRPPWEVTLTSDRLANPPAASLRAVADDRAARLTCEIWINGARVDQRSAAGAVGCLYDPAKTPAP
jgi:hypothetical protein